VNVTPEEALIADARQRVAPPADLAALLQLDQLVQALLPGAVGHQPPGVFVDDHHLAVAQQVMLVALHYVECGQRLPYQLLPAARAAPHAAQRLAQGLELVQPAILDLDAVRADAEIAVRELRGEGERLAVQGLFLPQARLRGQNERRARLVHQHAVGLVDDRELQAPQQEPLHAVVSRERLDSGGDHPRPASEHHAVAQVVERYFLVAAVGDVAAIGSAPRGGLHSLPDAAHGEPEGFTIHRTHPVGVAHGKIVVDRDDVYRTASECRGGRGKGRGNGLALAGLHLGQHAVEHRPATDELHVEVALRDRGAAASRTSAKQRAVSSRSHRAARRKAARSSVARASNASSGSASTPAAAALVAATMRSRRRCPRPMPPVKNCAAVNARSSMPSRCSSRSG
jgi:hypothetical protein